MPVELDAIRGPRIAICGSASVGKTTLAHALSQEFAVPCLEEEMREYLVASGGDMASAAPTEIELVLLRMCREREQKEQTTAAFVADNCAIDFAAYALYYGCLSADSHETLVTKAAEQLQRYDTIFLLPWGVLPYEQDGVRSPDQYLQLRYQLLLEGLLRRYADPLKLHLLPETLLSLQDRIRWAEAKVSQLSLRSSSKGKGAVSLVGAGPGDPKLLTLRAAELLQQADVVAYDLLISPELLACIPSHAERLPVGRRYGSGATSHRLHPAVLERARAGKTVVRLKSGDPLIFGRGGEEAEDLREAGIPFEIVPGITAALGAAAYAGIPLTHRGAATEILLRTGHDAGATTGLAQSVQQRTTVLYMAAQRLSSNLIGLQNDGYPGDTPAALILSATTPRQQVISGTLATLAQQAPDLPTELPAILFVGRVVALRKHIAWFRTNQLRGTHILVARARPGISRIAEELRRLGATVMEAPSIQTRELEHRHAFDQVLAEMPDYDALVFGCATGVKIVAAHLNQHHPWDRLPPVICIGEQVGDAWGQVSSAKVPVLRGSCADALQEQQTLFAGKRLLLITSSAGRPQLEQELGSLGAQVRSVAAYDVIQRYEAEPGELTAAVDLVVLPSSSAARNLLACAEGASLLETAMIAIGPHTGAFALASGVRTVLTAPHDDVDAIVSSVLKFFGERAAPPPHVREIPRTSTAVL